ncbi:MAG: hypothetical protein IPL20_04275 [Saprospiraceae bacterium]|nr:hypothetical protein [Saprospiraceae bacterium]
MKKLIIIGLSIILFNRCLQAQSDTKTIKSTPSDSTHSGLTMKTFSYFSPEDKYQIKIETDTNIQHEFSRFDPTKKFGNEHITLGNLFSPAYRLLFKQEPNLIFNHGFEAYQPYKYTFQNYRFYTSKQPLTEVFFSQFSNQLNFSAGAKVAIPFANGWNFSLDYFRVSQQGFYRSQSVKSTNLTTGMKYQSNKDRYSFIISYIQHVQDEKNNGGIKNESDLISFPLRGSVPTNIENAQTRHQSRTYSIVQYLRLAGNQKWKLFIHNTINFEPSYFKYAHATKEKDTSYYGSLLFDVRGVRRYTDIDHTMVNLFIHGENNTELKGKAGIQFDAFNINDQSVIRKRRDISLIFSGDLPFFNSLTLKTKGLLGIGNNAGNFNIESSLNIDIGKWAILEGGGQIYLSEPTYAQENLILNDRILFIKSFKKSFGTKFYGNLKIPFTKTTISAIQNLTTNPVFWQTVSDPKGRIDIESTQSDEVLTYTSLQIFQNIRIANIDFNHGIFFQIFNQNLYHLPTWYSVHQLYWNPKIFKKALLLSIGGEARFIPLHKGVGFSPLHGQFFTDNSSEFPLFPDFDLILNAKIKTFRISLSIENAGQWFSEKQNFDVRDYPRLDPLLRFSVRWQFVQ